MTTPPKQSNCGTCYFERTKGIHREGCTHVKPTHLTTLAEEWLSSADHTIQAMVDTLIKEALSSQEERHRGEIEFLQSETYVENMTFRNGQKKAAKKFIELYRSGLHHGDGCEDCRKFLNHCEDFISPDTEEQLKKLKV